MMMCTLENTSDNNYSPVRAFFTLVPACAALRCSRMLRPRTRIARRALSWTWAVRPVRLASQRCFSSSVISCPTKAAPLGKASATQGAGASSSDPPSLAAAASSSEPPSLAAAAEEEEPESPEELLEELEPEELDSDELESLVSSAAGGSISSAPRFFPAKAGSRARRTLAVAGVGPTALPLLTGSVAAESSSDDEEDSSLEESDDESESELESESLLEDEEDVSSDDELSSDDDEELLELLGAAAAGADVGLPGDSGLAATGEMSMGTAVVSWGAAAGDLAVGPAVAGAVF